MQFPIWKVISNNLELVRVSERQQRVKNPENLSTMKDNEAQRIWAGSRAQYSFPHSVDIKENQNEFFVLLSISRFV